MSTAGETLERIVTIARNLGQHGGDLPSLFLFVRAPSVVIAIIFRL